MPARVLDRLALGDLRDPGTWLPLFAPDIHLRVGARPPALGRDAAGAELGLLLRHVHSVDGIYAGTWSRATGGAMVAEVEFGYGLKAVRQRIPCAIVARAARCLLIDLRFYLDPSPLLASDRACAPGLKH